MIFFLMSGILIKINRHTRTITFNYEKYFQIPLFNNDNLYK